jgi:hypothetical protein
MPRMFPRLASVVFLLGFLPALQAQGQGLLPLGLEPPSGSQNPSLVPPSGSQNPIQPPPSGSRYVPGTGGRWGGEPRGAGRPAGLQPASQDLAVVLEGTRDALTAGTLVNRIADVAPAIARCWVVPVMPGISQMGVTLRFSLRRDGSVIGAPRVSAQTQSKPAALQGRLRDSALAAVRLCTPLRLSSGFGGSIAGRPLSVRFIAP